MDVRDTGQEFCCPKLAFVTGFPDDVSVELQQISDIDSATLGDLIGRARILVSNRLTSGFAALSIAKEQSRPTVAAKDTVEKSNPSKIKGDNDYKRGFSGKCYRCQGPHMIKNCPEKAENKSIICYRCGEEGHIAPKCTSQRSGNE